MITRLNYGKLNFYLQTENIKKGIDNIVYFMYNILGIRSYFVVCFIRKSGGVALCLEHISLIEEKERKIMASETE